MLPGFPAEQAVSLCDTRRMGARPVTVVVALVAFIWLVIAVLVYVLVRYY